MAPLHRGAGDGTIAHPPARGRRCGGGSLDGVARPFFQHASARRVGGRAGRGRRGAWSAGVPRDRSLTGACDLTVVGAAGRRWGWRSRAGWRRVGRERWAGDELVRPQHAQLARILHPHRKGTALLVGAHDFDPVVARERRARPAHLVLGFLCARGEPHESEACGDLESSVANNSHGRPPGWDDKPRRGCGEVAALRQAAQPPAGCHEGARRRHKKTGPTRWGLQVMRGIGGLVPRLWGWRPAENRTLTPNCYVKPIGSCLGNRYLFREGHYMSIPPMPPGGPPWLCSSSFGASATMTSVVSSSPATEAAFCSARRATLVGSRMPSSSRSPYLPVAAL